jgi:hypothetical protein
MLINTLESTYLTNLKNIVLKEIFGIIFRDYKNYTVFLNILR